MSSRTPGWIPLLYLMPSVRAFLTLSSCKKQITTRSSSNHGIELRHVQKVLKINIAFVFLACFPKVGLYHLHSVCVYVNPPHINFWMPEPIFMELGMYVCMYVYHGTWAHLNGVLHKSPSSVRVCVSPRIVARQRLCRHVTAAAYTRRNRKMCRF
jgi:hypothetical protein